MEQKVHHWAAVAGIVGTVVACCGFPIAVRQWQLQEREVAEIDDGSLAAPTMVSRADPGTTSTGSSGAQGAGLSVGTGDAAANLVCSGTWVTYKPKYTHYSFAQIVDKNSYRFVAPDNLGPKCVTAGEYRVEVKSSSTGSTHVDSEFIVDHAAASMTFYCDEMTSNGYCECYTHDIKWKP